MFVFHGFHRLHLCPCCCLYAQTLNIQRYLEIIVDEISTTWLRKLYEYPLYIDAEEEMSSSVKGLTLINFLIVFPFELII